MTKFGAGGLVGMQPRGLPREQTASGSAHYRNLPLITRALATRAPYARVVIRYAYIFMCLAHPKAAPQPSLAREANYQPALAAGRLLWPKKTARRWLKIGTRQRKQI